MVTEPFINNMVSSIAADLTVTHTLDRLQSIAKGEFTQTTQAISSEEPKPKRAKKASAQKTSKVEPTAEENTQQALTPESESSFENSSAAVTETVAKPKRTKKVKSTEPNSEN
jgi:hypothetical protein